MTTSNMGFSFDANSRLMVVDLVASAVPNTANYNRGFAFKASDGSLYVTSSAIGSDVVRLDGIARRNDGAAFIINGVLSSEVYHDGIALSQAGAIFTSSGGTIDHYSNGLPITSANRVVTT